MITKRLTAGAVAVLLAAGTGINVGRLNAQGATATIQGNVTDSSGAAIADTTVQLKNINTGTTGTAATNAQGRFVAADLSVGEYEIQASKTGFQTVVRKGITLTVGAQSVVDFSLPIGQQQQTVTVEGQASQVETANSSMGTLTEPAQMRELPLNGRNFEQLIVLAPGVQQITAFTSTSFQGRAPEYSIAGARPTGQALLLDDESLQGFWSKGMSSISGSSLGMEAIGEFQTLTNTYSAQFGGNGAVVNAVTKSGTNAYHGSAFEFLRNSVLDARNTFAATNPPFRRNQFGGSLGGPIKKDKAFIFVNYEGVRQALTEVAVAFVPDCKRPGLCTPTTTNSQAANAIRNILALYPSPDPGTVSPTTGIGTTVQLASQPITEDYVVGKFDYTLSAKDAAFVRYITDRSTLIEPFAGGGSFGNGAIPYWPEHDESHYQFVTLEERRLISNTLVNIARVSYSRPNLNGITPPVFPALQQFFPGSGREDGLVLISGLSGLGSAVAPPFRDTQNRFTEADDVSWTHGAHAIRFGAAITRLQSNTLEQRLNGSQWNFQGLAAFLSATPATVSWTPVGPQYFGIWSFRDLQFTPYVHDDWKIAPKLTLNVGLRWEFMTNPVEAHNNLWNITDFATAGITSGSTGPPWPLWTNVPNVFRSNPTWTNLAPRFGFAYDPFADHKTSIRGGFGGFYDTLTPATYAAAYWQNPPYPTYSAGTQVVASVVPTFPVLATTGKFLPTGANGNVWDIGNNPYLLQWNLNVQRELARSTVLTAGYLGSRGIHLLTARNMNPNARTVDANGVEHFGTLSAAGTVIDNPVLNPNLGAFTNMIPTTLSRYNALQVALNRRFTGNVQAQVSYTWSKCLDNGSYGLGSFQTNSPSAWTNPYNQAIERGPCSFDITHVLSVNGLYALPFRGNKFVEGWQFSGIFRSSTGVPLTIADGVDAAGLAETNDRPNAVQGCDPRALTPAQAANHVWYNTACFKLQPLTTLGNLGRGTLRGPLLNNLDLAFLKDTKITKISESFDVQFRAEFFNILNHPNYGLPGLNLFSAIQPGGVAVPNPSAGKITSIVGIPRQIQFALKILF